jgi:hypothetical protein
LYCVFLPNRLIFQDLSISANGKLNIAPKSKIEENKDMTVHIFRGPGRVFGFTEDAAGGNLPARYSPWNSFKTVTLSHEGEPTPGVDTRDCLDDIEKHGFHITDAHVRITERVL